MPRKKILIQAIEEYNLTKEQRADVQRIVARITGRKVTGEVVINLGQGSAFGFSTRESVKKAE